MEWRKISNSDYYEVSDNGLVRSVDRYVASKGGSVRLARGRIIIPHKDRDGYLRVGIYQDGKSALVGIHRLVAEAFIPNPNNLPIVHHINGKKDDNRVENLEWSTVLHNNSEDIARNRKSEAAFRRTDNKKKIRQCSIDGESIKVFNCIMDMRRELGFDASSVIRVCQGKQNTSYGYKWEYYN